MRTLKELVEIRSGYTFRSSIGSFDPGDVEVIQASDLGDFFDLAARPKIMFPGEKRHFLKPGDILLSARGFSKAVLYQDKNSQVVASSSIFVLTPKNSSVSPEFITMFFNSVYGMKAVFELSSGAAVRSITKASLGQVEVPYMPSGKERALGRAVQAIDEYMSRMREKEIYLDSLRDTIISKTLKEAMK